MENTNTNVNATEDENNTTETKCIFNYRMAKSLVRLGHRIVDLKINRDNGDPIYVFEDGFKFRKDWQKVTNDNKKYREERAKEKAEAEAKAEEVNEPTIEQAD